MRKAAAILLTGCITFQSILGSVVPVWGSDLFQDGASQSFEADLMPETYAPLEEIPETEGEMPTDESLPSLEELDLYSEEEISLQENVEETQNEASYEEVEEVLEVPQDTLEESETEEEAEPLSEEMEEDSQAEPDLFGDGLQEDPSSSLTGKGALEVIATWGLPLFEEEVKLSVLVNGAGGSYQEELCLKKGSSLEKGVTFQDLEDGTYRVTVKAEGFANYTQDVQVKGGQTSKIRVYSAKSWTDQLVNHPGILYAGDVTGDRQIDEKDSVKLAGELHKNTSLSTSYEKSCDLDGDGQIALADLQLLAANLGKEPVLSHVENSLSPGIIQAEAPEGTVIEGGAQNLLVEGQASTLRRENNEPITENTPVSIDFNLGEEEETKEVAGLVIHAPIQDEDSVITSNIEKGKVSVLYEDEEGTTKEMVLDIETGSAEIAPARQDQTDQSTALLSFATELLSGIRTVHAAGRPSVKLGADGSLTFDFGGQIAVKKISISITGTTKKDAPLVEITKVEFLNDMEDRIPAPELNIPSLKILEQADHQIQIAWDNQRNVTGYEVMISGKVKDKGPQEQVIKTTSNSLLLKSINGGKLINKEEYTLKVRSTNGQWKSQWSTEEKAIPVATKVPDAPDFVHAEGGFGQIKVSWKDMDDTDSYMVYYREKGKEDYIPVGQPILGKTFTIPDLSPSTTYEVCVSGYNDLGEGKMSNPPQEATTNAIEPKLPGYRLLNTSNGSGVLTEHIKDITIARGRMIDSPLDKERGGGSALGLADGNYGSYWQHESWEDGGFNNIGGGITVTFDEAYDMNYITFTAAGLKSKFMYLRAYYRDEKGKYTQVGATLTRLTDEGQNDYYRIKLKDRVHTDSICIRLSLDYYSSPWIMNIGEMRFYSYDTLEEDILALYSDDSCTSLKEEVTLETLDQLEERLNTKDPGSNELHPEYTSLSIELNRAREIYNGNLEEPVSVLSAITAQKDKHLGFTGLNAWQPLGRTAASGDKILVYVGNHKQKVGEGTNLSLIVTQHHANANSFERSYSLKIGRNEITIPQLHSIGGAEKGGQLYVSYNGNNANDNYVVRVSGGQPIPVLNLYKQNDQQRKEAILAYMEELQSHVQKLSSSHDTYCKNEGSVNHGLAYSQENCILNATDIMMDQMMYSIPATQVWNALRGASLEEKAQSLDAALKAMEDTMTLFYQHKGLSDSAGNKNGNNALPAQHLNIRYMRMFKGAFMYASGNHIGIEWSETPILGSASKVSDFGWGIAHEIGHDINQGTYAVAEVTNNYFAQLLTGTVRYKMDDVYKKVTSGVSGTADNVFTALAMYWQLHLAHDNNADDYAVYSDYDQQFKNLFFARVDTYSRNPGKAPNGLKLGSDPYQNIMRLSCGAAEKNLLPFFEKWGLVPDETTRAYGDSFPVEERALYYADSNARDYRVNHLAEESALTVKGKDVVTAKAKVSENSANQVLVSIQAAAQQDAILGYEIIRTMISNGKAEEEVVGFAPYQGETTVYTDTIVTVNNRVMGYKVRAVDKFLYYSATANAGSQKISTLGNHDKSQWTVSTTMFSFDDKIITPDMNDPDTGFGTSEEAFRKPNSVSRIADNDLDTFFVSPNVVGGTITVDMHQILPVTSLIYRGTEMKGLTVSVSSSGSQWIDVKKGGIDVNDGTTIWLDSVKEEDRDNWIGTYDVRYVRLTFPKGAFRLNELEICGPSGDNLEFAIAGETPSIGILKEDCILGKNSDGTQERIPKDSLVITGFYKGNPAYNVVMVYDEEGNVLGSYEDENGKGVRAEQVIFAPNPENGNLGEVSQGTWVYYLEPGTWTKESLPRQIRAELYRVDNALTNEGERIVSDTQLIEVPSTLPSITLTNNQVSQGEDEVKN